MSMLLRWDVSAIPADSTIQSATVILNVVDKSLQSYSAYSLKQDWSEGGATWESYRSGSDWAAEGAEGDADRFESIIGRLHAPRLGTNSIVFNADGIAAIQAWVQDPADNHGIIIVNPNARDGIDIDCSEVPTVSNRPILQISYVD